MQITLVNENGLHSVTDFTDLKFQSATHSAYTISSNSIYRLIT